MGKPVIVLTNRIFGRLTVIKRAERPEHASSTAAFWACKCACGNTHIAEGGMLRTGRTKSCGCFRRDMGGRGFVDFTGMTFGRWTVIKRSDCNEHTAWLCRCNCGSHKEVSAATLVSHHSQSCGCITKERIAGLVGTGKWGGQPKHTSEEFAILEIMKGYRRTTTNSNSKRRTVGKDFSLSVPEFTSLIKQNCFYCGCPPSNSYTVRKRVAEASAFTLIYSGIDRVDNSKGYTTNNCVTCCSVCNKSKRDMPLEQFSEWVRAVYWHYCVDKLGGSMPHCQ